MHRLQTHYLVVLACEVRPPGRAYGHTGDARDLRPASRGRADGGAAAGEGENKHGKPSTYQQGQLTTTQCFYISQRK